MITRIDYIDKLKGFAIILVVMGHVLEWGMGISDSPANLFYSSFHMPLFMFLSGLFAMKSFKTYNLAECQHFLYNKVRRIVVPFLVVGEAVYGQTLTGVFIITLVSIVCGCSINALCSQNRLLSFVFLGK